MKARDMDPGTPAALAALIIALDECGAMPKERYLAALRRVWSELPENDCFDEQAIACQQLLDYLG